MTPKSKIPENIRDTGLLRSMAKRRGIVLHTISEKHRSTSTPLINRSSDHPGHMASGQGGYWSHPTGNTRDPEIPAPEDIMKPSVDIRWHPRAQRIWWRIRGRWRAYWGALFPKPTREQLEEKEFEREEKQKDRTMKREGKRLGSLVGATMLRVARERLPLAQYERQVRWTRFERDGDLTKIILHMDLDPDRLPYYVFFGTLVNDDELNVRLAGAVGHELHWEVGIEGVALVIRMRYEKPKRKKILAADIAENDDSDVTLYI